MSLSKTFSALSDPSRLRILELLKKKEMPAGEIGKNFSMTAPSLSHHLAVLKEADLVSARRDGQSIFYSINLSVFEEAAEQIFKFLKKK
jgi:DNA-binding transcriptional ArsR family regulator